MSEPGYISIKPKRKPWESYEAYKWRRNRYALIIKRRFGTRVPGRRK